MNFADLLFRVRFNAQARGEFYEAVANFTHDGIALFDCLEDMLKALKQEKSFLCPMLIRVMGRMRGREGSAMELGQALQGFCPVAETSMIAAGERAGDLPLGLRKAQHLALTQKRLIEAVTSEMIQPVVYLGMVAGLLLGLSKVILPAMEAGAKRVMWPIYARLLGTLADNAIPLVVMTLLIAAAWVMIFVATAPRMVGPTRKMLDKWLFPWGLYAKINEAVMLLTVASMIRVGLPFETAVEAVQRRGSGYMRHKLTVVRSALKRGNGAGEALIQAVDNKDMRWQIAMYAKTTAFATGLEKLADRGTDALITATKKRFSAVGFAVLALVALMVVWTLGSFFGVSMSVRASRM